MIWILMVALIAGCGAKQKPETPTEPKVSVALTRDGLQPFPEGELSQASLEEVFAGYAVAASDDGQTFAIRDGGDTIVLIEKLGASIRAKVTGEGVAGPAGIRVGADWSKVAALSDVQCRRGASPWSDQAFCTSSELPGIVFGFDLDGITTSGCVESCRIEDLSAMEGTKVRSIDWQPTSG
jgi:hypothetical protein